MWTILIGAIVNLLIFFFQRWWASKHPTAPGKQERAAFLAEVNSKWRFKLVPQATREKAANQAFDQFAENYNLNPPVIDLDGAPLTQDQAKLLAQRYADGIA